MLYVYTCINVCHKSLSSANYSRFLAVIRPTVKWLCCGLNDTLTSPLVRHGAGLTTGSRDTTQLYAYLYDEANKLNARHSNVTTWTATYQISIINGRRKIVDGLVEFSKLLCSFISYLRLSPFCRQPQLVKKYTF